ncbi:DUF3465 domain-containing protein [Frateuria aurantia]
MITARWLWRGVAVLALMAGVPAVAQAQHSTAPCDVQHFLADQQGMAAGTIRGDRLEDVCGAVVHVYGKRRTRSGWHGYFLLQVAPNQVIRIVSDLDRMNAPAWPWVAEGDRVTVRGRYYYDNPRSQGIDWTHHGTSRNWPTAGYVVVNGRVYQ